MLMIYLIGITTKDFEGGAVQKTGIKVKRNVGNKYDFFDIVAFNDTAEECKKVKGGSKVAIEGTLNKNKFGETWYYSIVINEITILAKPTAKSFEVLKEEVEEELKDNPIEIPELPDDDLPF